MPGSPLYPVPAGYEASGELAAARREYDRLLAQHNAWEGPRDCTCDCSPYLYDLRRAEWRVEIAERDLVAVATLAALRPILRAVRDEQSPQRAVDLWVGMLNAEGVTNA